MSDAFTIEFIEPCRLVVRLRGELEVGDVQRLSSELLPRLRELRAEGELIMDLHALESFTTAARMSLTELQRGVASVGGRTAFVADRPRLRGLGLYVAHMSEDPNARSFHLLTQATVWLRSTEERLESITSYLRWASKRNRRSSRRSSDEFFRRAVQLSESSDEGSGG